MAETAARLRSRLGRFAPGFISPQSRSFSLDRADLIHDERSARIQTCF